MKIFLFALIGLFALSSCDSSDTGKESRKFSRSIIRKDEMGGTQHKLYCKIQYEKHGYTFNPNDDIDKYCIDFLAKEKNKPSQNEHP